MHNQLLFQELFALPPKNWGRVPKSSQDRNYGAATKHTKKLAEFNGQNGRAVDRELSIFIQKLQTDKVVTRHTKSTTACRRQTARIPASQTKGLRTGAAHLAVTCIKLAVTCALWRVTWANATRQRKRSRLA